MLSERIVSGGHGAERNQRSENSRFAHAAVIGIGDLSRIGAVHRRVRIGARGDGLLRWVSTGASPGHCNQGTEQNYLTVTVLRRAPRCTENLGTGLVTTHGPLALSY
jgi:hypothetical protein